jgi:RNA polymerase sigma-70 factor (ECF subfamily)
MASDEVSMDGSPSMQTLFEQVYENHYQVLYAYFVGRTADTEAAQDLLQETFLRVWRHRQSLPERTDEQQRAWLFAIARNLLTDYYRHRATRSAIEDEVASSALPSIAMQDDMDAQVEEREYVALLDSAIKRLPEDLRTVLVLAVLAEMSSTEMSAVLGKPAGTIRYQLAKARKHLADELQRFAPGPPRKE